MSAPAAQQVKRASLVKEPEIVVKQKDSDLSSTFRSGKGDTEGVSTIVSESSKLSSRPSSQRSSNSSEEDRTGDGEGSVPRGDADTLPNDDGKDEISFVEWSEPFVMPPDDKVFQIRAEEKIRERENVRRMQALPISEKTTFASRVGATIGSQALKNVLRYMDVEMAKIAASNLVTPILQTTHYHREKENMVEFIQKKREIFLVQMSLDIKRAEIRKLEDRTFQREEALRKSEEMLEEDTIQFDSFLKQNDERLQEAIKNSELQVKLKQDKVSEIKKLNGIIAMLKSDVNKLEEQLEDCKKYKDFLIILTPKEWLDEQVLMRQETLIKLNSEKSAQNPIQSSEKSTTKLSTRFTVSDINVEGDLEEASDMEDDEEEKMYFEQPGQLLELFGELEGENLALMQQSQDTEDALESLQNKYKANRAKNDAKIASLRTHLKELELAIEQEEERHKTLQTQTSVDLDDKKYDVSFEQIATKVNEIYGRCGLEYDISLGTLQMLTNIEAKLEECLVGIEHIPKEFIDQTEKVREKERRYKMREAKLLQQKKEQEERRQRSLARARAPIFKRKGPPVMFRSYLWRRRRNYDKHKDADSAEEAELEDFIARDY